MASDDAINVKGEFVGQSDSGLAIQVVVDGNNVWIPESQISCIVPAIDDLDAGDSVSIDIPTWLAESKGLI